MTSLALTGLTLPWHRISSSLTSGDTLSEAPGLTHYVSEFIVKTKFEDVPPDVLALGKKSILDGFGVALAGSASAFAPLLRQYIQSLGIPDGKSSIIGTAIKVPARFAAFANGVSIHSDDFDDTQLSSAKDRSYGQLTHPTVPVLSAAFALCEAEKRTAKDLLLAYFVGVEVECKIAEAIFPRHYRDGFHSTGTCGSFGSSAACAKLRGLIPLQTEFALGIAGAQAAGLSANNGSMTKPFQAGHAAENGILSADLASLGWTAADDILEAPLGFFQAAGGGFDPALILDKLGNPWTFASPGVSIKPFPCGSLSHPAMGEMLSLIRKHNIKASDVEKVDVGGTHSMMAPLLRHHPTSGLQAKFSMEFCMSILLLEGRAGLREFTDVVVQRPDVQEMIRRINFYIAPEAEQAGLNMMTSLLRIHLKSGQVLSGRAEFAKGSPADPMTYDEVAQKFRGNAEFAKWPEEKTTAVIELVKSIERLPNLDRLTAALTS